MSIIKRLITLISLFVILLTGCDFTPKLTCEKTDIKHQNKRVIDFINLHSKEDGVFLLENKDTYYLYINNVISYQSNKIPVVSDVKVESNDDELRIFYNEDYNDYKREGIESSVLYKISLNKKYDSMYVYKNGKKTYFNSIDVE
ncbi:hypothetical protein GJ688_12950 [Heliobacillus mobilis]|uniref:Lipoprotein n=1 Tax=Heliobacterium mobile TaxID=28064 RepID=A0A6I3SLP5_HELMO|nr:hypothetical protein [Heliobacterium mobile]MTV49881.1 hypothetical protein [Heliobacterium mobile]